MSGTRVAVIYYSSTGTNHRLAEMAAEEARRCGAEVRLRRVAETAPEAAVNSRAEWRAHQDATSHIQAAAPADLEWAEAIIFSMPTRFGHVPAQMQQFLDTTGGLWAQGKLANKVVSAMTSAQNAHGGQESTLLGLYVTMYHWGAIVVTPGYTDATIFAAGGNPYGTSVTATDGTVPEAQLAAVRHQVRRVVEIAGRLAAGQRAGATNGRQAQPTGSTPRSE